MVEPAARAGEERDQYGPPPELVAAVCAALADGRVEALRELIEPQHTADVAELLNLLSPEERRQFVDALGDTLDPELLIEIDPGVREEVVAQLGPSAVARAVPELDTDDAVYLLEDLDDQLRRQVLDALPEAERRSLEEGLAYGEDTAGRLMQRELVAVPEFWTVGQTIDHLRETADLPDRFHEIFVVDPAFRPVGTLPLDRLLRTRREVAVSDFMEREQTLIPVDMDQEQVALLFGKYGLLSAAVIGVTGRLVGVITVDDVVDVISEEAEEDILHLGGVSEADLYRPLGETARTRFPWLLVNVFTALLASTVIAQFDATIGAIVALAILMPIVTSMGGNAGTQTLTVAVRGLATRQLTPANARRVIGKEVAVGGINGLLFAVLIGGVTWAWFGSPALGVVIGAAMIINFIVAGLFGALVPLALDRLRVDPAIASSVFLTMLTDVVGFFAFLGLAALFLL